MMQMAKLERVYNVPLRKEWLKAPPYKRAKKAVAAVRQFLMRHMKGDQVKLGSHLNEALWERGIKKPPHHVKVTAIKDDDGIVRAELFGLAVEAPKKEEKKGALEGLKEKLTGGKRMKPAAEKKAPAASPAAPPLEAKAPAAAKGKEPASPGTLEEAAEKAAATAPPTAGSASPGEAAPKQRKSEKNPSAAKGVKGADEA